MYLSDIRHSGKHVFKRMTIMVGETAYMLGNTASKGRSMNLKGN